MPARDDEESCTRVFVGSLAYTTTWQALKDHFKPMGDIDFASIITTPAGQSKGCGMVDFKSPEDAANSVIMLNDSMLDGRSIQVKLDVEGKRRQLEARATGQTLGRPPPEQRPSFKLDEFSVKRVFVGNLAYTTNWQALKDHFKAVAPVELATVLLKPDRTSKGCGMVDFLSHEAAAQAAAQLNNSMLDGRSITVKLDTAGVFRERPPIGNRVPIHQVNNPKRQQQGQGQGFPMQGLSGHMVPVPVMVPQRMAQQGVVLPMHAAQGGQAESALMALSQMAMSPGARNVDWPNLVRQVAQTMGR